MNMHLLNFIESNLVGLVILVGCSTLSFIFFYITGAMRTPDERD